MQLPPHEVYLTIKRKKKRPSVVLTNSQAPSHWLVSVHLILIEGWNPAIWNPDVNHGNLALFMADNKEILMHLFKNIIMDEQKTRVTFSPQKISQEILLINSFS